MARAFAAAWLAAAGCEVAPPVKSDSVDLPYLFSLEYALEHDAEADRVARARVYDVRDILDITGNAGTVELTGEDALYADDVELSVETWTAWGSALRIDYSQVVPGSDAAVFELRRGDGERIVAEIPPPDPFTVSAIGVVSAAAAPVTVQWGPTVPGSELRIEIVAVDDDCLLLDLPGGVASFADDPGQFVFDHQVYHHPDHDCRYDLRFLRTTRGSAPSTWVRDGADLPGRPVSAVGVYTAHATFVAERG